MLINDSSDSGNTTLLRIALETTLVCVAVCSDHWILHGLPCDGADKVVHLQGQRIDICAWVERR